MPCIGVSFVILQASASATIQPSPRLTIVVFFGSSSGMPPTTRYFADSVPIMVTTGIASAGMKSLLPSRLALAEYCTAERATWRPIPTPPKAAISAITTTPTPTQTGGSWSPTRNTSE
ncbi:hypothetical protein D3C85_1335790 [compost metagenome]